MGDSLTPGSAHIIRVIPVETEVSLEQNNESKTKSMYEEDEYNDIYEEDEYSGIYEEDELINKHEEGEVIDTHEDEVDTHEDEVDTHEEDEEIDLHEEDKEMGTHEDEEISEDEEHDPLLQEGLVEEIPGSEFTTYLVYEANQMLPELTDKYPGILTDNLHLKEASNISNIIHPTSLVSNIIHQVESKINKESKESEMLCKISLLEKKIKTFYEKRKEDKRRIKTLLQSQRRNMKTIAALKEDITVLKKQNYIAHTKTAILKEASPFLVDLLSRHKITKQYSSEVREFVKDLYSISPNAYRYVRNYFDMSLPHEKTALKWKNKTKSGSTFDDKEVSSGLNPTSNFVEMEVADEEEVTEGSLSDTETGHVNT